MNCPDTHDWDLLGMEVLEERATDPLFAHLKECPDCRGKYERARRSHLDRIRMYDQLDRGHDSLREQLMAALPPQPARSRADRLVRGWRHMGDFAMTIKHKVGARATIGLLSAAACIGFAALLITFAGSRSAFATAIEQFQKARTIVCRVSSPVPISVGAMTFQQTGKLYVSAEHGGRFESLTDGTMMNVFYTPPQGPMTVVTPVARTYMVIDNQAKDPGTQDGTSPDDFIFAMSRLKGQASRELGRMTLDGIDAVGYEIPGQVLGLGHGDRVRSELWVDAKTYLPVRYVAEMPVPQTGSTCQMVFDRFEWDTPLDPQIFVPDIPADYTRLNVTMPVPDEAGLIKGLGSYADLTGKYPPTLDPSVIVSDMAYAMGARISSLLMRGEKAPDLLAMARQKSVEIGSAISFYHRLTREGCCPEYNGKTVSPGQADAVLLRWKLPDGQWRVIHGDLRTDTVNNP